MRSSRSIANFLRIPLHHEAQPTEIIVGESYNQEAISPRLIQALVELVVNQTFIQTHPENQHKLKDQLLLDLLQGQIKSEADALSRARHLGLDLTQPRAVILVDAASYILKNESYSGQQDIKSAHRRAQIVISSIVNFFHLPDDTICVDLGQGNVCVLKASNTKNLDPWDKGTDTPEGIGVSWANLVALRRAADALLQRLCSDISDSINIGIGRYHPGLKGLARSYEDARAALSLGSRLQGRNQVYCLGKLGIAAFVGLADENTKIDLAKYLLSPLDQEPELLSTLDIFFSEDCCPSLTAKRLSVHRNTLSYRLEKIASLTGLDPRKFDDAVQMRLSLLLRSLQNH
jgi:carbohydrate diacid regulator